MVMVAGSEVAESLTRLIDKIRATPKDVGLQEFRRIHWALCEEIDSSLPAPSYAHRKAFQELWVDGHGYHNGLSNYMDALRSFFHGNCNNGCKGEQCERARYNVVYVIRYFARVVQDVDRIVTCPPEEVEAIAARAIEPVKTNFSKPAWAIGVLANANHDLRHCLHGADLKSIVLDAV